MILNALTHMHEHYSVLSDLNRSDSLTGIDVGLTHTRDVATEKG